MLDPWLKYGYEIVITEDSSPSLRWLGSETQETMHHRGGAYSETQLIYGNVVRDVFAQTTPNQNLSFMSVGLGLGYNELVVAIESLKHQRHEQVFLRSYEIDKNLVEFFVSWLRAGVQSETQEVYQQIANCFQINRQEVANVLLTWLEKGQWQILSGLQPDFARDKKFNCILYDAFSSKTSPHLWQEEFMTDLFTSVTDSQCLISTYACTGTLKRSLKASGFQVLLREGFASKRNSTLGIKEFQVVPVEPKVSN